MRRVLAEPLLHFVALGAALFVLHAMIGTRDDRPGEIVVSAGRIRSLSETFARQWGRPPADEELSGLVRDYVREEVLSREAIALGLDRDDTIVRRRLAQKMEFLGDDATAIATPTDDDLRAFLAAHPERFAVPSRYGFAQVFLDPAVRGDALDGDAARLVAMLDAGAGDPGALGDSRLLPPRWDDVSHDDVVAQLGAGFAATLDDLPVGRWSGPVQSAYGVHLVRVERRTPGTVPSLDDARAAVAREWTEERRREAKDAQLRALLDRYQVTIEADATETLARIAKAKR